MVGLYGIVDILIIMSTKFKELKERKDETKEELATASQHARISEQITPLLIELGLKFEREFLIRTNGERVFADFLIHGKKDAKYILEILTRPTPQNVYLISTKFEPYTIQNSVKTILVLDSSAGKDILNYAKPYWDFLVDLENLVDLKKIIK